MAMAILRDETEQRAWPKRANKQITGENVTFQWFPSQCDISNNEIADKIANHSSTLTTIPETTVA